MPPLIVLAGVGVGLYFGMKYLSRQNKKKQSARKKRATNANAPQAETLKRDPVTGVYKVDD